jgi:hypothetical protein
MTVRKRKWFIPVVVLFVVLIGGIAGGMIAAADSGSSDPAAQNLTGNGYQALLDRACAIYQDNTGVAIDSGQLANALKQARGEMRGDALRSWLQSLVNQGKITQEQASQYLEWWQSRPDVQLPLPGHGPRRGMIWGADFQGWGGLCGGPESSNGTGG